MGDTPVTDFSSILARVRQIASMAKANEGDSLKHGHDGSDSRNVGTGANNIPVGQMGSAGTFTLEYRVPANQIGRVIGKGGETIHRLQEQAHCHMQVVPDAGSVDRTVTMTGSMQCLDNARRLINECLEEFRVHIMYPTTTWNEGPISFIEIIISAQEQQFLEGIHRDEIAKIEQQTNATISLRHDKPCGFRANSLTVWIHGNDRLGVNLACDKLKNFLSDKEPPMSAAAPDVPYGDQFKNLKHLQIDVPRAFVGAIIGRGGETIKRISMDTGARVQFDPDAGGLHRILSCNGPEDCVQRAEQVVKQILADADSRAGGGHSSRQPPPGAVVFKYNCPATRCGIIIGRGGETIKSIIATTGAHVELERTSDPNPLEKIFVVTGTHEQVEAAKASITEKLNSGPPRMGGMGSMGAPRPFGAYGPTGGFGGGFPQAQGGFQQQGAYPGFQSYQQPDPYQQQYNQYQQQPAAAQYGAPQQATEASHQSAPQQAGSGDKSSDEELRKQWETYYAQLAAYNAAVAAQGGAPPAQ